MTRNEKLKAGHYEIQGETIAKFELFEQGWNPYSRYLDIDKIDLILRKRSGDNIIYREIQVKYGKLYDCTLIWENGLFDVTSWKFINQNEFENYKNIPNLFLIYVLARNDKYDGDIFLFPIKKFHEIVNEAIVSNTKKGEKRKLYLSRSSSNPKKWYARKNGILNQKIIVPETCIDISEYYRNFEILENNIG